MTGAVASLRDTENHSEPTHRGRWDMSYSSCTLLPSVQTDRRTRQPTDEIRGAGPARPVQGGGQREDPGSPSH